ncbi:RagB/SusD family nutrient uptake outer membrane protein, partial [Campylobacter jejuni]|nr:RagB/SusD family nutrient uptake outer membrane protein [Campylobacter jejuni]
QYIASFIPMITLPLVGEKCKDDKRSNSPRGMRVAEAYLNRAEANIRLFLESGNDELRKSALNDLNYLREFRFIDPYVEVDIQDGNDLL